MTAAKSEELFLLVTKHSVTVRFPLSPICIDNEFENVIASVSLKFTSRDSALPALDDRKSSRFLILKPLTSCVLNCSPQILKMLNSNTENPYLIWDNATRAELTEFLEREQSRKIETVNKIYNLPMFTRREPA